MAISTNMYASFLYLTYFYVYLHIHMRELICTLVYMHVCAHVYEGEKTTTTDTFRTYCGFIRKGLVIGQEDISGDPQYLISSELELKVCNTNCAGFFLIYFLMRMTPYIHLYECLVPA